MVVRRDKLDCNFLLSDVGLNCFGTFVVHNVEGRVVASHFQLVQYCFKCCNHGIVITTGHWDRDDGIYVVDVGDENVYHIFVGSNRELAGEVSVHCACFGVGEGCITKHVLCVANFFDGRHVVNFCSGITDGSDVVSCRLYTLACAVHMAFVSCCGWWQVLVD